MAYVKTAVSLPEALFVALEAQAQEAHQSRSAFIAEAVAAHLRKIEDERFVEKMNEAVEGTARDEDESDRRWMESAALATLRRMHELDGGWPAPS